MIIHFSVSHESVLITVCLSNYNKVCCARLAGKEAHGKQVMCSVCPTKMHCDVMVLIPNARLELKEFKICHTVR